MASKTVTEYVLYRGAFNDEKKHPLFSHVSEQLVRLHALEELRARPDAVLSMSKRLCTYPVVNGVPQAQDSTCDETEEVL